MLFPAVSIEEWMKVNPDLEALQEQCPGCEKVRAVDIPFITKDWAGFISRDCDCGCSPIVTQVARKPGHWSHNLFQALLK